MTSKQIYKILIWFPIVVIPLFYNKIFLDPGLLPRYLLLNTYLIILAVFVVLKPKHIRFNVLNNWLIYSYLAFLTVSLISLSFSINQADGIFAFYKLLLGFLIIILLVLYYDTYNSYIEEITKSISIFNLTITIIGLVQFIMIIVSKEFTYEEIHSINATFIHKNIFAEMIIITMPFSVYSFFAKRQIWKYAGLTGAILSIALIIVSMTRAVWIAALMSILLTSALMFFRTDKKGIKIIIGKQLRLIILVSGVIITLLIIMFSRIDIENSLSKQISSITNFGYGSTKERLVLWKNSLSLVKENPITGDGLGGWKIDILKFGNKGLKSEDNITFYTRPHNDYIWVLTETGIAGFVFFILTYVFVFVYLIRMIMSERRKINEKLNAENKEQTNVSIEQRNIAFYYAAFFALVSYLTFSFFSFPIERIEHTVIMAFIISAVIIARNKTQNTSTRENKNNITYVVLSGVLIILMLTAALTNGIQRSYSETSTRKAYMARAKHNWEEVIYELNKADNNYYRMDPVVTPLAWYKGESEYNLGKIDNAFNDFQEAYRINPYHIHVLNNLGTCYELKNDHKQSIKYYELALKISPNFEDALLNLAAVTYITGDINKSYNAITAIDTNCRKTNFKPYLIIILKDYIKSIDDTISLPMLRNQIKNITDSDQWIYEIYKKSKRINITCQKQLFIDAINSLANNDKKITFAKSSLLKKKYKL